jgi:small conductance mechanosensitive channel
LPDFGRLQGIAFKNRAGSPHPMTEHDGTLAEEIVATCENALECWVGEHVLQARLVGSVIIWLIAFGLVKLGDRTLTKSAQRFAEFRHADEYKTKVMVGRTKPMKLTIRLLAVTFAGIALLGLWGLQTAFTGLLAGAGFAGIVIGLAAADTIGDVIAGFLIFYNQPFEMGDWVDIDGTQGIIDDVALGATTLITFDNEKVTIPNRIVEGTKIKNFSHARRLRRRLVVGVEYGSHLGKAMETLVELASAHPDIHKDPVPQAVAIGFGASSVELEVRFWVEPVRSSAIKIQTDLIHAIHDTFRKEGIVIAFPHMQIVQAKPWQMAEEI